MLTIRAGCKVMLLSPAGLGKGAQQFRGYYWVDQVRQEQEKGEQVALIDLWGRPRGEWTSMKDVVHVGQTHSKCDRKKGLEQ